MGFYLESPSNARIYLLGLSLFIYEIICEWGIPLGYCDGIREGVNPTRRAAGVRPADQGIAVGSSADRGETVVFVVMNIKIICPSVSRARLDRCKGTSEAGFSGSIGEVDD